MPSLHPVLIVPGLGDSEAGHWQTWLEARLPNARRVYQHDWRTPNLKVWAGRIRRSIEDCEEPPIVVAHSFGVLAAVHALATVTRAVHGLLLVAPADPVRFGHEATLSRRALPFPTTLVTSQNDAWMSEAAARTWGEAWGARIVDAGRAGHINVASGHGPWAKAADLLGQFESTPARTLQLVRA